MVAHDRYRHLVAVRRDRQRARIVSNNVVSGDTRRNSLIAGGRRDIRSDLQRITKCTFNCRLIGIQRPIVGEGTGKLAAVIFLAVGLGRNRQRQRIVDGDDIAICADRDRLARVVAVDRQILALIFRDRLCRILGPDRLLRNHILRDLGRGTLQVVVNRDRGLVQIKVYLQDGAAVAGDRRGQDAGRALDKSILAVLGLSLIRIGSVDCAAGLGRTRVGQLFVLGVVLAIVILIIELNGIVYIKRFPHGVEIIIRIRFIRRNIGRFRCLGRIPIVLPVVIPQEVRCGCCICGGRIGCAGIQLIPAEELVSCTRVGRGDGNRLVDLQRVRAAFGRLKRAFGEGLTVSADVFLAVAVAEPPDKGIGGLTLVGKHSLELEHIVRALDLAGLGLIPLGHSSLRVVHIDREGRTRKDSLTCLFPGALGMLDLVGAVPLLHDPV